MVWLATEFVFASPRGKLWAIRNFYRNVWTPAQQQADVAFTLATLIAGTDPGREQRAT